MNLILTSECNKHCSFCFAKEYTSNPETEIFNFEFLKEIITEMNTVSGDTTYIPQIKLLGGEPTRYPQFIELMNWLTDVAKSRIEEKKPMSTVCLISNFLYQDERISKAMKDYIDIGGPFSLLLNVSEMTQAQKTIVRDNVAYLMQSNFEGTSMSFGFTINPKFDFGYYEDILNYLRDDIISPHRKIMVKDKFLPVHIRLSLANPERGTKKFSELLNEKTIYSKIISDFVEWGATNDAKIRFDCGMYPCLFDEKTLAYLEDWSEGLSGGCGGSAFDLFPTGKMINCYPGNFIEADYQKYKSVLPLFNEVDLRHKMHRADCEYPDECKKCRFFMNKCNGPCSGYL